VWGLAWENVRIGPFPNPDTLFAHTRLTRFLYNRRYLVGSSESLAQSLSAVGGVALSPLITAVIERAMPVRLENQPPPWVLDFTLYASPAK